jgi:SAM-dependent methyltransferase
MPQPSTDRPYRWLAPFYDQIFSSFGPLTAAARQKILAQVMPQVESACDLACGSGTTALALAREGIKMFAVDLSPDMCRLVRKKARGAGLPMRVLCADMREFRLPQPVDLITCEFDALNHVPHKADLLLVAKAAARATRPGGYFFFDVNTRSGFERYWSGTFWIEKPGLVMVIRNDRDLEQDKAWSNIEMFIQEGPLWRRRQERIEEVCWSATEIRQALREAGFDRVRAWDAARFFKNKSVMRPGCRTFYLARRSSAPKASPRSTS